MIDHSEQFREFRAQLDAKGVRFMWTWQSRRDGKPVKWPKQPADVGMLMFQGNGFQPSILCALVIDYGPGNGFGLFTDEGRATADDVTRISTPRAT